MADHTPGPGGAVFLSYASEDTPVAERLCSALRAAGIEVWFDKSELRGGDSWDFKIRQQIRDCALFIPMISEATQARLEGYFRREWRLAADRMLDMADAKPFVVPVVIDDTRERTAQVPESFLRVQWARLRGGDIPAELIRRIADLLEPKASAGGAPGRAPASSPTTPSSSGERAGFSTLLGGTRGSRAAWVACALLTLAIGYLAADRLMTRNSDLRLAEPSAVSATTAPHPAVDKSIAVLPFSDLSENHDQEYFSDGLAEELLDRLAKTPDLRVTARTSSFYFKGKQVPLAEIAGALRVANILEGSVRKAGSRIRVTTQLIRADSGDHLWSETYDREMKDIFELQDEIAGAVVAALKLKLAPQDGTADSRPVNLDAYLKYLIGHRYLEQTTSDSYRLSIAAFREAIALDPHYAAAHAGLAVSEYFLAEKTADAAGIDRAVAAAQRAIELAPEQSAGYAARARLRRDVSWDWSGAQEDFTKALSLSPNDPLALRRYASLLWEVGRLKESLDTARKATELDPLSTVAWQVYSYALLLNGDIVAARQAILRALAIDPKNQVSQNIRGDVELVGQRPADALTVYRGMEQGSDSGAFRSVGIAMAEYSLSHEQESQQALESVIAHDAQNYAYQIATVYAWRRSPDKAFEWLDRAYRQRDSGLIDFKTDLFLASLHGDPRYKLMLKKLNIPE